MSACSMRWRFWFPQIKKAYEIADEVGFSDVRSFTEVFARLYGETPGGYRKRIRSADMGQDI